MGHAVFVFGAAGAGKTTFCRNLRERGKPTNNIRLINLDPAYESAEDYDIDLCDHITVQEVMDSCDFGPNGALFHALQEMVENLDELHLQEMEDEFFVFDCPGQIELFLHSSLMQECINHVKAFAKVVIVYLTDATNFIVPNKELYSSLCATLCMSRFCLPVINIISKADLLEEEKLEDILGHEELGEEEMGDDEYSTLRKTIIEYVNGNGMLDYLPLDWKNDEMVENIYLQLDNVLQRYDDIEPTEHKEPGPIE